MDGVIREASLANSVSDEGAEGWVGRPWAETVGEPGSESILRMLAAARTHGVSDFGQVPQRFASGLELPVEYHAVRLGAKAGLIAIGRNLAAVAEVQTSLLAAQRVREQEAWKLRAMETRSRLLPDSTDDPVLLLQIEDLSIIEANPAAVRAGLLDAGRNIAAAIAPKDRTGFRSMLDRVAEQGRAPGILVHLGAASAAWLVRASLEGSGTQSVFLVQLAPVAPVGLPAGEAVSLEALLERLPDGFALIDAAGIVRRANPAFLELVQVATPAAVIGIPLGRWLSSPGADAAVLLASLARHRVVRRFATALQGELGTEAAVEISAAGDRDLAPGHIGLLVRDVSRRLQGEIARGVDPGRQRDRLLTPLAQLTEQIGQVPLLQLVAETSSLIERHCIEGALERANGNRTAAAELLGLSRQSLYAKLSRHGLGGQMEETAARA